MRSPSDLIDLLPACPVPQRCAVVALVPAFLEVAGLPFPTLVFGPSSPPLLLRLVYVAGLTAAQEGPSLPFRSRLVAVVELFD